MVPRLTLTGDLRIGATSGGGLKEDSMPYTITRNASGAAPALVANRTYEGRRDVLHKIENSAGGTVVSSYTYEGGKKYDIHGKKYDIHQNGLDSRALIPHHSATPTPSFALQ